MRTVKGRIEELEPRVGPAKRIRLRVVVMRVDSPLSGDAETMDRIERALDEAGIAGLVDLCAPHQIERRGLGTVHEGVLSP